MNTISVKQIIMINALISGDKEPNISEEAMELLEKIALAPFKKEIGWDSVYRFEYETSFYEYRTVVEKAAKLGCDLCRLRPFERWNTKTAIAVILTFLDINNISLKEYSNDIPVLIGSLNNEKNGILETVVWIKQHIRDDRYGYYPYD